MLVPAPIRLVFFGTPSITLPTLRALHSASFIDVVGIVTQPDKPKGRNLQLEPCAAKVFAHENSISCWQPLKVRDAQFIDTIRTFAPEVIIVFAYGQILPQSLLDLPRRGCINIHTSLLPKYRGAAPIQWPILNGDSETGVTLMQMEVGLDTGPIISKISTPISSVDNAQTLHDRLAILAPDLLLRILPDWMDGTMVAIPQPEGATYARKIVKEDGAIDWTMPAVAIVNQINGLTPWPGTFSYWEGTQRLHLIKVLKGEAVPGVGVPGTIIGQDKKGLTVACGENALRLLEIQREGGRRLLTEQFLAGFPLNIGSKFVIRPPVTQETSDKE